MTGILSWWDGVELWLSGLGFVLQTLIVMPVVLALAYGIAVVVDARSVAVSGCCAGSATTTAPDDERMPRSRVTLALVALLILVLVVWLLNR